MAAATKKPPEVKQADKDAKAEAAAPDSKPGPDPKSAEPVMKIRTKDRVRPTIEIDDMQYEMRTMRDFGIGKQQALNRDGREFGQLWTSDTELTDDQSKRLKFLLERIYPEVIAAPKTVLRKLDDAEKAAVVLNFTLAPLREMMTAALVEQTTETEVEAAESPSIPTS